jgi:tetratricopeptide (TPR) repeat protein
LKTPRFTLLLVAAALVLPACRATRNDPIVLPDTHGRVQEATRLATQAQNAQRAGDTERAIDLYRQSLAVSGDMAASWNNLGVLLMSREENLDAVAAFKRASELSQSDPRPLENIGLVYSRLGWEEKALEYYLKALDRSPNSVKALRGTASATKLLAIADEQALARVRTALLVDADPDWRRIYEMEQTRIDGQLRIAKKSR